MRDHEAKTDKPTRPMTELRSPVPFTIYTSDDGSRSGSSPLLICTNAEGALPPHPHGNAWLWVMTSSEEPRQALIGRSLLRGLARHGYVITPLTLQAVLRGRSAVAAETLTAARNEVPLRSRTGRREKLADRSITK